MNLLKATISVLLIFAVSAIAYAESEKRNIGIELLAASSSEDNAGLLKEYIWTNHGKYIGGLIPAKLKLKKYAGWASNNLSEHSSRIEARLNIK